MMRLGYLRFRAGYHWRNLKAWLRNPHLRAHMRSPFTIGRAMTLDEYRRVSDIARQMAEESGG